MTHRISPISADLLFPSSRERGARIDRPVPKEPPHERKTRRAGWFAALRHRPPLA